MKKKTDEEFNKIIKKNRMNDNDNMSDINKKGTRFNELYNYRIDYKKNKDKLKEKIYNKYSFKLHINGL